VKGVGSKAKVEVNKEKPGKGNFVIRVEGVEDPVIELTGMKRPFKSLKALDMEEVLENVLKAIGE
jgi:translation initiation factor 1 (eIF-1/SUI1)